MPTKSFVTPGVQPPFAQDMSSLAQEQAALQEALQRQSGGTSVKPIDSGAYQVLNFDGLANALAAKETQRALENNRKKSLDVQGKYQQGLVESLKKFDTASIGGDVELPGPTEGGQPLTGQVLGDQRAFTKFLNSPYPEVRAAAERQRESYDKRFDKSMERASLTSIQASGGDLGALRPKPELKVDQGAVIDLTEGRTPIAVAGKNEPQTLADGTQVDYNPLTGKRDAVNKAPQVKIDMGNKAGTEVLQQRVKKLEDSQEMANKRADTLRSTEQALASLQQGATTGYGAEWVQNARTAVSMLTGQEFGANTPTAVLQKALAENVVNEFGGKLGSGISASDVTLMGKATGDANTDGKAIERILAIRAAAALRNIEQHNKLVNVLSPYTDKALGPGVTAELYPVQKPSFRYKFSTAEAAAAFEAGASGRSYRDVLKERQVDPTNAPSAAPTPAAQVDRDARLKALGITPYKAP